MMVRSIFQIFRINVYIELFHRDHLNPSPLQAPIATPMGFAATIGMCAAIPLIAEIKQAHTVLVEHFDALVRASGEDLICENGARVSIMRLRDVANELSGGKNTNAWIGFEVNIIAMGAGWYDGMSGTELGIPRPPLCHYK